MNDGECLADFKIRVTKRLKYPGACSLEYQNLKQIIIETLLQWDTKNQRAKGKGILGRVLAFAPADEEQGRITLHSHWQIWLEELNQSVRDALFHPDKDKQSKARQDFCAYIDEVMNSTHGTDLEVKHMCKGRPIVSSVDKIFKERKPQDLRNARHKNMSSEMKGKVMECKACNEQVSTVDIINMALDYWKGTVDTTETRSNIPNTIEEAISSRRLDIAAYTYSYQMENGCSPIDDPFWSDISVRKAFLAQRFDEHAWHHRNSCFKKVRKLHQMLFYTIRNSSQL